MSFTERNQSSALQIHLTSKHYGEIVKETEVFTQSQASKVINVTQQVKIK